MTNLFDIYPDDNQSAPKPKKGVNLFDLYGAPQDEEAITDPRQLAEQQIKQQYPNVPDWLRQGLLKMIDNNPHPTLENAAEGFSKVSNYIPAVAGGLLQGASLPIRGVAGLIPTDFTQKLANSRDLRDFFPKAEGMGQQTAQLGGELVGAGGLLGKLFQGARAINVAAKVPKALQTPLALAETGYIGTPGDETERGLGAAGGVALGAAGKVAGKAIEKVPSALRGLFNKVDPDAAVKAVQKPHDILQNTADELYGQVRQAIKKRNIKFPVNDSHLEKVAQILSDTRPNRKLIEKAKSGDYEAVHELQSHLYKKGTKGLASDDIGLENQGEEILDLRDKINEDLDQHLIKEGNLDISHVLKQGKKAFAQLKDTYFGKDLRKSIGKMVQSDLRLIPENPLKMFKENSLPMKAFLDKHPEVRSQLKKEKEKEEAINLMKKIGIPLGVGGVSLMGGKTVYDIFK